MDIHKPKPIHSWRELFKEIGIIFIGVVIALAAEQALEALRWKHRVGEAEIAIRRELGDDIAFAVEQQGFKTCAGQFMDRMQAAIQEGQPQKLRALAALAPPFNIRPWRVESWNAALSGQITDHISRDALANYGLAFRSVATEREMQYSMHDRYAEVMAGRTLDKVTPEVSYAQQAALDKLRGQHDLTLRISLNLLLISQQMDIAPSKVLMGRGRIGDPASCEKQIKSLPP